MSIEEEVNIATAQDNARRSAASMLASLPARLQKDEDRIAAQLQRHKGNAFAKITVLHDLLNAFGAAMAPFTACKAGCDACCHYNVSLFPIEARYIEHFAGHKQRGDPLPAQDFHGQPCPFLKEGRCGIYNARPISCRLHVAFTKTAYWCSPARSSEGQFQQIDLTGIREALVDVASASGGVAHTDIRQVFGVPARWTAT
ncbi:YkgJ family cysteine cluster protein [Dyella tabacisoli]|uniref:YkgJ family cysteine cluster protein n=1 Tax=Dyella tabacisoli TaxID=2282381 RepID=A0A369UP72_9GAMM|nr:YkgJ family cysteine cluster protein [Dyella tabacisoli]RDD80129.1 YkgJ family cysteine cluster protein [Dyella tabacisoli]